MNNRNVSTPSTDPVISSSVTEKQAETQSDIPTPPTVKGGRNITTRFSPFWHDRFVECALILSMMLYYIVGNPNVNISKIFHVNPLFSLPFLLIFALLCWYRLPFAAALLPLSLPYYLLQKPVMSHYEFSLAEVTLGICLIVAGLQLVFLRQRWAYRLSWSELRNRLGPFALPVLVFLLAATLSIGIAYNRVIALRSFREEVLDPLLYMLLALACLRSRHDITRLLGALLGTGLVVALLGLAQYFIFKHALVVEDGVRRVHAVYGSANSIGLLFDYVLPIAFALLLARVSPRSRLGALIVCLLLLPVLYLTQSLGAWIAIALALLFILVLSLRSRQLIFVSALVVIFTIAMGMIVFHMQISSLLLEHHTSGQGVSTVTKRLYLWQSALHMIHNSPWLGYGMDNWLCHYSKNSVCDAHGFHYWIITDPVTGVSTGLQDESKLSHPHNIFLHVWVSMGVFGVLAFSVILILFYWLFVRILATLRTSQEREHAEHLRWMTVGVGAAMFAALIQGQVDSAFLEQDLAFCFWTLVAALLLLRMLSGTTWHRHITSPT